MDNIKTTVLICTYKRKELLDNCLFHLIKSSSQKPDEIVVVDGEEGGIKDLIDKWQKVYPNIKYIPIKNINLAHSRNIGLKYCRGDIICFTDDDCVVEKDWLKKIIKLHKEHPEAGGIGGKVLSLKDRLIDKVANLCVFPFPEKSGYLRTICGANASYKKEAMARVGKFDENLVRGEDVDFNWRIIKAGYKIYYCNDLIVYHRHRDRWRDLFYQLFMYGRNYYLVRKKWPDMYCIYPHTVKKFKDYLKLLYLPFRVWVDTFLKLRYQKFLDKIILFFFVLGSQISWYIGILWEFLKRL